MYIFVDESGSFAKTSQGFSPSVVGALVVPDLAMSKLLRKYAKLRLQLPKSADEVKGRMLDERSVARIIDLLRKNGALFEAIVIDVGFHTEAELEAHKRRGADALVVNLTNKHHPNVFETVNRLRSELLSMPEQQYLQAVATFMLIAKVISHSTLYFSQRVPKELGAFHWIVDAKDRTATTDWEKWWTLTILPWLQSYSMREPMPFATFGDYSWFSRFEMDTPDYLKEHLSKEEAADGGINLRLLLTESFRFSSTAEPGLELVDIVTNAVRRALVGNLQSAGWADLPDLMIREKESCLQFVGVSESSRASPPYTHVVRQLGRGRRDMLAPRVRAS